MQRSWPARSQARCCAACQLQWRLALCGAIISSEHQIHAVYCWTEEATFSSMQNSLENRKAKLQ